MPSVWRVALADGETLSARFLITATGFPVPAEGARHPRRRRLLRARSSTPPPGTTSIRSTGRRWLSSAPAPPRVQLIPELAKKVADLTVYQRTPIWVVPKIDLRFGERAKRLFARIP